MFGIGKKKEKEEIAVTAIGTVAKAITDYRDKTGKSPTEMVVSESFSNRIGAEFLAFKGDGDETIPPVLLGIPTTVDKHSTLPVVMR